MSEPEITVANYDACVGCAACAVCCACAITPATAPALAVGVDGAVAVSTLF